MTTKARKRSKLDVEAVRQAASGRWLEILQSVAGIPADALDGSHHPCPKCGGDDRFRLIDEAAGAVLCNQCFSEKNGDGFAAVAWARGVKFPEAVQLIADYLGVAASKGDADPAKDLRWMPWNKALAAFFLQAKPGVTEASLLANGARMARYKERFTVIALPIIGQDLDTTKPVGWVAYNYNGGPLPVWNREGVVVRQVKVKTLSGSKAGLVGVHAIERLKAVGLVDVCWKVEGVTDLLAATAAIPEQLRERHVAITNAGGAGENPKWLATPLANANCNVIHDADKPGQAGAEKWSLDIAAQAGEGVQVRNVPLPYEVAETHGKDLRDWIGEGRTYGDLLSLAEQAAAVKVARTESGEVDHSKTEFPDGDRLLKKLQIEVLYEEESGAIRVFSTLLRKSSTIKKLSMLKHDDLHQIVGPPATIYIVDRVESGSVDEWTMKDLRKALGQSAARRRGKNDERGVGVWQGLDEGGNETETVVLVGNSEGARWNGDKVLRRILAPRADGLVLDFGATTKDWYEFDQLEKHLASAADVDWRQAAIDEAVKLFSRWRWRNPEVDPTLMAGLVLATWVQTVWDWRPLVAISGESNSGKSFLFEALGGSQSRRGIFGSLAFKQAKSTAAGIMQGLGNTARVALCDEFEASKERTKILEAFRQSTRGETTAKGTSHHRGVEFVLRHIGWVAAVETGLTRQPDANRFIQFELLTAQAGQQGKLKLPDPKQLVDLGQRLLAVAVRCAIQAKRLAVALKDTAAPGIDPRTVESYGVPAAILAVAMDSDVDVGKALLLKLLANVDQAEQGRIDQEELLGSILTASVNLGGRDGTKTVGQVLESPTLRGDHAQTVEASGVRLIADDYSVFIAPKLVSQRLLQRTEWEGQKIDQILLRLPGAKRRTLRIAGQSTRGIWIPENVAKIGETEQLEGF